MSSNDDILHLYYITLYVQVYYLSINELKLLTNLEKYFMSSSRLDHALLLPSNFF